VSVALLERPTLRADGDGHPIRRVVTVPRPDLEAGFAQVASRLERVTKHEGWGQLGFWVAASFASGILTYNMVPFVGWGRAALVAPAGVLAVATAWMTVVWVTPPVVHCARHVARVTRTVAWLTGFIPGDRATWLPPVPPVPMRGQAVILPWHQLPTANGVLVRRTRIARPVSTVLFYDEGHVIAIGHVKRISSAAPGKVGRTFGARLGMTAETYRNYTRGHDRVCVLELDGAWSCRPFRLDTLGIRGRIGAHRYLGGKS
jgi:hypothetical protein